MKQNLTDSFILMCKQNRIDNITPSNQESLLTAGYHKIVSIAQEYFNRGEYKEFSEYFQEGQYLVPLWAAHMILEFGTPPLDIMKDAIEVIERYSENPLSPDVAEQEKRWLIENLNKYKQYY